MDNIELLQCMIETEINKLKYQIEIARKAENKESIFIAKHQMAGLKKTLSFMEEIENMEEQT